MKYSVIIALCCLMALSYVNAEPIYVVGMVFDNETGEPISYAEVKTRSGKSLGKSNSRGRFELEVETRNAILVFMRGGFRQIEIDLSEYPDLIDLEIGMDSEVKELQAKRVFGSKIAAKNQFKKQSVEELEQFQGMRIDLNDHLRQLEGVSGMTEYSSDISIYGGRTEDVTHYLDGMKIQSMRHLDFGFPGNQSVINPRLLKSVSVEDNLAKGPITQGNSSALKYQLKEGDPEYITADVVFGTINREFNTTFYWDSTTIIGSYRNLQPTFLANLGKQFYTLPKESRLGKTCQTGVECVKLSNPIDVSSEDFLLSIYNRDARGGYIRGLFLGASDDYKVSEDLGSSFSETKSRIVQNGHQYNLLGSLDYFSPSETGLFEMSGIISKEWKEDAPQDTTLRDDLGFYSLSGESENQMGLNNKEVLTGNTNFMWTSNTPLFNAEYSYGGEITLREVKATYMNRSKHAIDIPTLYTILTDGVFRLIWQLPKKQALQTSIGWHSVNFTEIGPFASARYNIPLLKNQNIYADISLRQNTTSVPIKSNSLDEYTTTSLEAKVGYGGQLSDWLRYSTSLYGRYYYEPILPVPDVYWNYKETQEADFATIFGTNFLVAYEPTHHFGINLNGSIVQGDYYLANSDETLPWVANRSLDMVSNFRVVPRKDSLLSIIITYVVNNGIRLYEHDILRSELSERDKGFRTIKRSSDYNSIARQRTDVRINLNLKSKWKPLDTVRFFFQGSNLFASTDKEYLAWLGGNNAKQRGWTRVAPGNEGNLSPVLIRGLGFFMLLGFELNLAI
ncbi:MAG: TonB-dependent receptor [Fibrobacteria bacterium]|nr:TonB-dependent receptor [Fibrobacteria bacterium]